MHVCIYVLCTYLRMYVFMYVCMCLFPPLFNFFRVPLNVLVRALGSTRTARW